MTPDWKAQCLGFLTGMQSQRDMREQIEVYSLVLDAIGEEYALKATQKAVLSEQWRPSPAQLLDIAARLASPVPNEGDCFTEFWKAVKYSVAVPRWSHPIIGEVVRRLGGWAEFEKLRPHLSDKDERSIWFARFMKAWEPCASEWTEMVGQQLALPPADRDPKYRIGGAGLRMIGVAS